MAKAKSKSNLARIRTRRVINALLLGTAAVAFWRGAWGLADTYLFPNRPLVSYLASFGICAGILIVLRRKRFEDIL